MGVYAFYKPVNVTTEMGTPATCGVDGRKKVLNDWILPLQQAQGESLKQSQQPQEPVEQPPDELLVESTTVPMAAEWRRIAQVGRLDKHTSGLLLLTDDGILNERVCRPGIITKFYEAIVKVAAPAHVTDAHVQ